ncbi:xanthine dehydrogenase small subunit [Humitalea rosea]|uniref:Xanthine dehydrogenase small subunit n=1 Tax=Humitalea rosea TaxID=990373 RepID=A0A2W7J448_9PROT|nr:FAD binding domain-containing protein [Humitalea rosea]PZW45843.1 xanthine dehydrogenase small subunit [Humitalea rosea]
MASEQISFCLNGQVVVLPPTTSAASSLLDWLRGPAGLRGTKEGCAEGDCGACTVALEEPDGARVPINACLTLLGQMHGRAIRTVEGLRDAAGGPHPVARILAEHDGTQCGFCTPGIVMSAWAAVTGDGDPHEALAGNLCRCTGYRPIVAAMAAMPREVATPAPVPASTAACFHAPGQAFHLPRGLHALLSLRAAHPDAWLLAGGTDLGLRVSEHRERPPEVICLLAVPELQALHIDAHGIRIGAAVPYHRLLAALRGLDDPIAAPFARLLARLGSAQIRGLGTLGGNLGTASPIGDMLPPLVALGAEVTIASLCATRRMAVEAFLTGYRTNALAPDEVVTEVIIPRAGPGDVVAMEKLSRRHDQDITAVGLSAWLRVVEGRIRAARVALGGVGPRVLRATAAEHVLMGAPWSLETVRAAARMLDRDIAPLDDLRGSGAWRRAAAAGLLERVWWRATRPDVEPMEAL